MAKVLMIQGTMSNVGKSYVTAGLLRVFRQDGFLAAPFKSQNMALNSYVTKDGLEMGRAQVMQAEAAGIEPEAVMNPILLKPTTDVGAQVIVNGKVRKNMKAREYFQYKKQLLPEIKKAYDTLSKKHDIIVIEGAGSPAEINLKDNDIVNMGMARLADAPVFLVGDIDRGGVFAQLAGTYGLLTKEEQKRVKGFVMNKFRGDKSILTPGIDMLKDLCPVPVTGVLPFTPLELEDEDSLSERLTTKKKKPNAKIKIGIIKLPHISNFTDFHVLEANEEVEVCYMETWQQGEGADCILLPGTKNTLADLRWLKETALDVLIKLLFEKGIPVVGICGGFQMLGREVTDEGQVEGSLCREKGLGILPMVTKLQEEKLCKRTKGILEPVEGMFASLSGVPFSAYEIHMGTSIVNGASKKSYGYENCFGTYYHGFFDEPSVLNQFLELLINRKGEHITKINQSYEEKKEEAYEQLADMIRNNMDMKQVYEIMGIRR